MFRNRFRQTTITLLNSAALVAGFGVYATAVQPAAVGSVGTAEQLEAGRTAYRTHCAGCHAGDLGGRGETTPLAGDGSAAGKMGLQFKRQFWEEDDQIYGGASKTDMEIAQIVYPSAGYHGKKGVLVGYYIQGQSGRPTGDRPPAERQALALEQGAKIHPQHPAEFETGFSVAWHRVAWNKGSWSSASAAARTALHTRVGSARRLSAWAR